MVKAEMLNPGGSVKDRAAYYLIREAEKRGEVQPGGTIVEGSFCSLFKKFFLKTMFHNRDPSVLYQYFFAFFCDVFVLFYPFT